ncbi:response regulator, partial [Methylobacterium sp. B1]|uniref:response regulator n=1 Tax=Methylobacterium sp. B1 TaxID=91459 RepID=UPI0005BC791C
PNRRRFRPPAAVPALPRAEPLAPFSGSPRPAAEPGDAGAPRSAPAPATADKPAPRKPAADHTGQGTILLVEDEDPVRAVNSRALSARGYTVLEAASGLEALAIVREGTQPIDLVVSDVVMPEMDGPTLLREVRKHQPDLKVIFVSGYAEDAFRKNLPEGETFNFLPKPFSLKQLVETVKKTMAD